MAPGIRQVLLLVSSLWGITSKHDTEIIKPFMESRIAAINECEEMASQSTSRTSQVASAINSLLHLEEGEQASLLDVIQDCFTMPSGNSSCDPDSESYSTGQKKTP